ncbi:pilin [Patescibacteria group bacterium]|nr:pilin [Patescibacteria group bacterium]
MKIKRFLGVLIILPILAGLFCGAVEAAAADDCDTKENCESNLAEVQSDYDTLALLYEAFLDCRGNAYCDDYPGDWWGYTTDKQGTEEECEDIYTTAKYLAEKYYAEENSVLVDTLNFTALDDIEEELAKERKELGSEITALKIYFHSFKEVDVKNNLKISNKDSAGNITQEQAVFSDAKSFLGGVIDLLIKMVGVAAIVFLVIGGFRLVVAAGNDNEIQKAKSMIQYAVVGLVAALLAYIIVAAAQGILYR